MELLRRKFTITGLIIAAQYFVNIKNVTACIGDGPYITRIKKESLRNVKFLGHKEYLNNFYPYGYEYSSSISIENFTNRKSRSYINLTTGKLKAGDVYHLEGPTLQLNILIKNIVQEHHCTNIRIIFQDNTNSRKGPCFEVANFKLGESTHPDIALRIKALSGQNPSFFVIAEIDIGNKNNKILVSNIYPFKGVCDGSNYLEITNA